ncbi:MAG: VCBS repeat-containing protein [Verrucomicrobia bacterium]|nr:VCBS repeat-containing protein [Verrucomicrobiota bacterium]
MITLTVTDSSPSPLSAETSFTLTVIPPPPPSMEVRGDFNRDGMADVVFQASDGSLAAWLMNGLDMMAAGFLEPSNVGDLSYRLAASGDFNEDGQEDLVFQRSDGTLAAWFMDGTRQVKIALFDPSPEGPAWKVVAAADFDNDLKPDLVLQSSDGRIEVWFMDGTRRTRRALTEPSSGGASWRVVGVNDLNSDGQPDLIFQHSDGSLAAWYLDGVVARPGVKINPGHPGDSNLRVVSTADRNEDGKPDLLFQHSIDGSLKVWIMDGINLRRSAALNPASAGGNWQVGAPR